MSSLLLPGCYLLLSSFNCLTTQLFFTRCYVFDSVILFAQQDQLLLVSLSTLAFYIYRYNVQCIVYIWFDLQDVDISRPIVFLH